MPGGFGSRYKGAGGAAPVAPVSGGFGSRYHSGQSAPAAKKKSGGGGRFGFLHRGVPGFVGHLASQTTDDLYRTAVQTPGGLYALGKSFGTDEYNLLRHPGSNRPSQSGKLVRGMGTATAQDLRHPLRHPGNVLLDAAALASLGAGTVARAGAAGRLVAGTGRVGEVLRPTSGFRTMRAGGFEVKVPNSRAASTRFAQVQINRLRNAFPERHVLGRTQFTRVGNELAKRRAFEQHLFNIPFVQLRVAGRSIRHNSPAGRAMRAVAEGTPLEDVIKTHRADLAVAKKRSVRSALRKQITVAEKAKQFVHDVTDHNGNVVPRLKDAKLAALFEKTKAAALLEDKRLAETGLLPAEVAANAIQKPGRIYKGAEYIAPTKDLKLPYLEQPLREVAHGGLVGPEQAVTRERSLVEAKARLAELDAKYEQAVSGIAEQLNPYADKRAMQREQLYRNSKKTGRRRPTLPTVAQEVRNAAETKLLDLADAHPGEPFAKMIVERQQLREAVNERALGESGHLGDVTETVPVEDFTGGQFHVGYERRNKPFAINRTASVGSANAVGVPRAPGRLTHALTGTNLREGAYSNAVPRIVAENALESERHAAILRARDFFISEAKDTPLGIKHPVAIWLDGLKRVPTDVKDLQDAYRQGRHLGETGTARLGMVFDSLRQEIFPAISGADYEAHPGVKWIDSRLLGGLNKPNPLATILAHPAGRRVFKIVDAVTNAQRVADLYLKPAYAAPNILGNAALNIIQQGFAAPANLARSALFFHRNRELAVIAKEIMGSGTAVGVAGETGWLAPATQALAHGWGKFVDDPFRLSSWYFEARRAGFKSDAQLHSLLTDPAKSDALYHVTSQAVADVIDYNRLGPHERAIVRRVVFLYPWVKGSTVYAGRFVAEHPQQAAFATALGTLGQSISDKQLGAVPSWWQGIIPVGKQRNGTQRFLNPAAATLFGSAAAGPEVLKGLITGKPGEAFQGMQYATPFAKLAQETISKGIGPAVTDYVMQTPQATLGKRLLHPRASKLSPMNRRDAILQYLISGTFAPRPVNLGQLHKDAALEKKPRRY